MMRVGMKQEELAASGQDALVARARRLGEEMAHDGVFGEAWRGDDDDFESRKVKVPQGRVVHLLQEASLCLCAQAPSVRRCQLGDAEGQAAQTHLLSASLCAAAFALAGDRDIKPLPDNSRVVRHEANVRYACELERSAGARGS